MSASSMTTTPEVRGEPSLELLLGAKKVGYVFGGGSTRCAFQVGVVETLRDLGIRPSLCIGVSGGVWNAASVAAGTDRRLRYYWRCFTRMPETDLRNLLRRDHSPQRWREIHDRTYGRYVSNEKLLARGALPLLVCVTRLRDRKPVIIDAASVDDPFRLLLAALYLPPFFTHAPKIEGERYGDGGAVNNAPYEVAFARGCDAVVLMTLKGESEGGLYRSVTDVDHQVAEEYRDRVVVIRPRHRVPARFIERRWPVIEQLIELGRLRSREILLGERHPETDLRAKGTAFTLRLATLGKKLGLVS